VLFRHEKTFVSPTGIAVLVTDAMSDADVAGRLERFAALRYERVGVQLAADLVAVRSEKGDAAAFEKLVQKAAATGAGLILMSEDANVLAPDCGVGDRTRLVRMRQFEFHQSERWDDGRPKRARQQRKFKRLLVERT
jgi:CO dehydrogenase/acetyl-CoA synthase gamma subunit (corrinoid Fe-S protein)